MHVARVGTSSFGLIILCSYGHSYLFVAKTSFFLLLADKALVVDVSHLILMFLVGRPEIRFL